MSAVATAPVKPAPVVSAPSATAPLAQKTLAHSPANVSAEPAAENKIDPILTAYWLQQGTMMSSFAAGALSIAASRLSERPWIGSAFRGCVAALLFMAAGTIISKLFMNQVTTDLKAQLKPAAK